MDGKHPEFIRMSKGIGKTWYEKYKTDTLKDYLHVNRRKHKIPRYYDKQLEKENPEKFDEIRQKRITQAKKMEARTDAPTHNQRDQVKRQKLKLLTRKI